MHRLLGHFLGAVRPGQPILTPLDLNALLRHCAAVQRAECEGRGISLRLHCGGEPLTVLGDGEQLQRALFNLLRNGIEALERGGTLQISSADEGPFARVEIEDDGIGIDLTALPRLFQLPRSSKHLGNGLGLLVVRRILCAHRATVALSSLEPHGTRVTLRFPLENPKFSTLPAGAAPAPAALPDKIPLGDRNLLDNPPTDP
jgi:signal transduction histidine kinase